MCWFGRLVYTNVYTSIYDKYKFYKLSQALWSFDSTGPTAVIISNFPIWVTRDHGVCINLTEKYREFQDDNRD